MRGIPEVRERTISRRERAARELSEREERGVSSDDLLTETVKAVEHWFKAASTRDLQLLPERFEELTKLLIFSHEGCVLGSSSSCGSTREGDGAPGETLEERLCGCSAGDLVSRSSSCELCALSSKSPPLSGPGERPLSLRPE